MVEQHVPTEAVGHGPGRAVRCVLAGFLVLAVAGLIGAGSHYWPRWYLHSARAALQRGDYNAARVSLDNYLGLHPTDAEAHLLLAQLDRRANNYADAARHLDACQLLGGPADRIELERGLAVIQQGTYNDRLDALCAEHLARGDADPYLILEAKFQGLSKVHRYDEALKCLDGMLALRPDNPFALRRRAWIHSHLNRHDEAEADYRRALAIDPDDAEARLRLAQLLVKVRQNNQEAAEHFERLWAAHPDREVVMGLAKSWHLCGRGEDARRLLDDWLRSNPDHASALAERGRLALENDAAEEAVGYLRRAVANAPAMYDAYYALLTALSRLGRTAEAEQCRLDMARAKEQTKQDKHLLPLLQRRLQQSPGNAELRFQIAEIYLRHGDEEGPQWLLDNIRDHPKHRPSYVALADYYARSGQATRAAEYRRLADGTSH